MSTTTSSIFKYVMITAPQAEFLDTTVEIIKENLAADDYAVVKDVLEEIALGMYKIFKKRIKINPKSTAEEREIYIDNTSMRYALVTKEYVDVLLKVYKSLKNTYRWFIIDDIMTLIPLNSSQSRLFMNI